MDDNNKLIKHSDFEIRKPEKITVYGFIIAWILVFVIIGITIFIASVGK